MDVNYVSSTLKKKNIRPDPNLSFGFLGLGIMGSGIVKNLLNSGHQVVVWNRTITKIHKFVEIGARSAHTPSDVIDSTDITFSCVSDPSAAKDVRVQNQKDDIKQKLFNRLFALCLDGFRKLWHFVVEYYWQWKRIC